MKTCLYQGIEGAFSYQAAKTWDPTLVLIGKTSFREVFTALHAQEADYALIPLENSLAGSIHENYDLFQEYPITILKEIYQKIEHCLLSVGDEISKIKKVFSHPKALEQCTQFLLHNSMEKEIYFDTAGAAKDIAQRGLPHEAAIASYNAGKLYNLNILKENIQDCQDNFTRFALIVANRPPLPLMAAANKCSLMIWLPNAVGALGKALSLFASKESNITKLESRPLKSRPFEYVFYIDCECDKQEQLSELCRELKEVTERVDVLGIYKQEEFMTSKLSYS